MLRLNEDLLGLSKVPTLDCGLCLNLHLGRVELLLPLFKDIDTLVDGVNRLVWLLSEDAPDINLGSHLVADLV